MEPTIRLAEPGDAEAIRAIYNVEVLETTVTFDLVARTLDEQLAWLVEHSGRPPGDRGGRRCRDAHGLRLAQPVQGAAGVLPDRRGLGLRAPGPPGRRASAGSCSAELVRLAQTYGYHSVVARIVGGHDASISLHAAHGFELVGIEREVGRKLGRWLDVVVMQRML